jgi:hypothetical protein
MDSNFLMEKFELWFVKDAHIRLETQTVRLSFTIIIVVVTIKNITNIKKGHKRKNENSRLK